MKRLDFLKNSIGFLGIALTVPSMLKANSQNSDSCSVTNSETEGPFPTITPASLVRNDITGDRTGIPFTINITINNTRTCGPLEGAIVDIWHCDKDGNYSEYGGTGMQPANYTSNHFLRGRQVTDSNGMVSYTSIFPGWYTSRATHIHVHIYESSGTSLLVTQIAFPEGSNSAVVQVNNATSYGYTKGMSGYTYNASDNVFSDGVSNEMSSVTGSIDTGFILTHTINVKASVITDTRSESAESYFSVGQNFPNPFDLETTIPLSLRQNSDVKIELYNLQGKMLKTMDFIGLGAGRQDLSLGNIVYDLGKGNYLCNVLISNGNDVYKQARIITKR